MKNLKTLEFFKKNKGNYLTKQEQPKKSFNEYIYDNGFGDRYYICSECDSYKLTPIPQPGFSPPHWKCDDCGAMNFAPKWISPEQYEKYLEDKIIAKNAKKYNL